MAGSSTSARPRVSARTPATPAAISDVILRHLEEFVETAVLAVSDLDPLLSRPDPASGRETIRDALNALAVAIRERRLPTPEEVTQVAGVAEQRALQGVPANAFARGYSSVLRAVWADIASRAAEEGIDG